MLLATRPDLSLLVIMGLVVVILWLVNAGMQMHRDIGAGATPAQRRNFIETGVGVAVVMVLAATLLPDAITTLEKESCWLTIDDGQTYQISSGETEEYCGIECDGTLNLNGTVELSG